MRSVSSRGSAPSGCLRAKRGRTDALAQGSAGPAGEEARYREHGHCGGAPEPDVKEERAAHDDRRARQHQVERTSPATRGPAAPGKPGETRVDEHEARAVSYTHLRAHE